MRPGMRTDESLPEETLSGLGAAGDRVCSVVVAGVAVVEGVMRPLTGGWLVVVVEVKGRGGKKSKTGAERSLHGAAYVSKSSSGVGKPELWWSRMGSRSKLSAPSRCVCKSPGSQPEWSVKSPKSL